MPASLRAGRAPGFQFCVRCAPRPPSASWSTGLVVTPTTKGPCTSEAISRKDPERSGTEAVRLEDIQVDCEVQAEEASFRNLEQNWKRWKIARERQTGTLSRRPSICL